MKTTNYKSYSQTLSSMGRVIMRISRIEIPDLTVPDSDPDDRMTVSDWVDIARGTDYWEALSDIREIVDEDVPSHDITFDAFPPLVHEELHSRIKGEQLLQDTKIGKLSITYTTKGRLTILAEYKPSDDASWQRLHKSTQPSDDVKPIELGRKIASAELSYLAAETGSCAAALDYWQTHSRESFLKQSDWAAIRGVNRQTVNDRVRDAKEQLEPD